MGLADGRWVDLEGGSNARDLGGLPLADGGETVRGVFFRTDTPQEWTEADLAGWRERRVALVVDLRAPSETRREGRAALDVEHLQAPLIPDALMDPEQRDEARAAARRALSEHAESTRDDDDVVPAAADEPDAIVHDSGDDARARHYLYYFEGPGGEQLAAALRAMAATDEPVLFHCAAGKDRTGALAMVLGELAGVRRDALADDYAATNERLGGVDERLRRLPSYSSDLVDVPVEEMRCEPGVVPRLLGLLDQRHGGVRAWALAAGVPEADLDRLGARLRGTATA